MIVLMIYLLTNWGQYKNYIGVLLDSEYFNCECVLHYQYILIKIFVCTLLPYGYRLLYKVQYIKILLIY